MTSTRGPVSLTLKVAELNCTVLGVGDGVGVVPRIPQLVRRDPDVKTLLGRSEGDAIAVEEDAIEAAAQEMRSREGVDAGPESGAALVALRQLREQGSISSDQTVVVFNTGGNKYGP